MGCIPFCLSFEMNNKRMGVNALAFWRGHPPQSCASPENRSGYVGGEDGEKLLNPSL